MMKMLSNRIPKLKFLSRIGIVAGLIAGLMFVSMFGSIASASISIGDDVKVTTNLNVRTGPGTGHPEIIDPDYPGYAPTGTMGITLSGPSSANGYTWWEVDYGPGLYSGWSVEGGLEKVQTAIDLTVISVNAPTSAEPGGYIAISWTVKNQGDAPSGSFYNRVSLATAPYGTDISLGNFPMNSIASGSSLSDDQVPKIPETISPRYYYVTVFTDAFQSITESNEYNNINKATYQIHITGCECTSGLCCDGCNFRLSSYVCDSQYQTEYGCPWGTECGDDVGVRYKERYCSGSSSSCSGSISSWGSWQVADYCGDTETCSPRDSTCNYDSSCEGCSARECEYNSQCYSSGTCHPSISKQKCSNGNWINSCGDENCNCGENSGNCPSDCCTPHYTYNCYNNDVYWYDSCGNREDKKEECESDSCGSWGSNYCGTDGNVYHSITCHDRGCSGLSCFDNTYTEEVKVQDCNDGNACTSDSCSGGSCVYTPITSCTSGDGCCPSGCNSINDNDCSVNCGNGICESGENCGNCLADCSCPSGEICCSGSCTTPPCSLNSDCNDYNSCTTDICNSAGTCSASCSNTQIVSCINNDGCCPSGCNSINDNDCSVNCGNGICESGENCGNCLVDCPCPSGEICCSGSCTTPPCSLNSDCNDYNSCTTDICNSAGTCSASCSNTQIVSCINNDGCCPSGCNSINDNDCSVNCGNGICESGENCGNCLVDCPCPSGEICCSGSCTTPPCSLNSDCNDYNSCTTDICNSAGTCSASCSNNPITSCINNDGCCPSGCDSINDNDCSVDCGNGVCDSGENCDNCLADCPCLSGQSCISGNCTTTCTNECSPSGTKTCTDLTHYKTCGDYDYDSCLEWSSVYSCPPGQTCDGGSCQVNQRNNDVFWLANVILSEASVGNREERTAVGWTVLNRLSNGEYGKNVEQVAKGEGKRNGGYSYNQGPESSSKEQEWLNNQDSYTKNAWLTIYKPLARELWNGRNKTYNDPTRGATHFFSPKSMEKEHGYGPYKIPGTGKKAYIPYWALPKGYTKKSPPPLDWEITDFYKTIDNMEWVSGIKNVGNWFFMFYRPISMSSSKTPTPIPTGSISSQDQDIQIGDLGSRAANLAEQVIGAPYLGDGYNWGGKGWNWNPNGGWKWNEGRFVEPNGIKSGYYYYHSVDGKVKFEKGLDCSGLVFWAYGKTLGLDYYKATQEIGEGANTQYNKFHNPTITKDNLKPGDLLFFTSHVGMYVGDDRVVHSNLNKGKVVEEPLEDVLKVGGFKGYGRVKQPTQNPIKGVLETIGNIIDKILSKFGF